MSSEEIVIFAQGLSKCYRIFNHPRDRLKQFIVPTLQRLVGANESRYFNEFWSLRDVSLEIRRGETVGIIGRNGAGKSTLLQILCGTLEPTAGSYQTKGRVAALLELGSGFNPEFSGRDNVYLNATLLGLTREEVDERFDAIAAFADIGEFIEQPVKTYSSGMYVRLAFAVIAHVDADILVVDEALAVGDAIFTQKCMRFIRSFQDRGTLLFVSHDVASVQNLCQSALWLDKGSVRKVGKSKAVAEAYLKYTFQELYGDKVSLQDVNISQSSSTNDDLSIITESPSQNTQIQINEEPPSTILDYRAKLAVANNLESAKGWRSGSAEITGVQIESLTPGATSGVFAGGEKVRLKISALAHQPLSSPVLGFLVRDRLGQDLFGENTLAFTKISPSAVSSNQRFSAIFEFMLPMLPNGHYSVMTSVADGDLINHVQHHWLHDALIIQVSSSHVRWGLVGVSFSRVKMDLENGQ